MLKDTLKGALVASVVAGLFAAGGASAQEGKKEGAAVRCSGVNACKGHGACAGADNACKGKNGCKGKGWVNTKSDKDCTAKGGTVVK